MHAVVTGAKSRSHLLYIASYLRHVLDDLPETGRLRVSFVPAGAFLAARAVGLDDARELFPHDARMSLEEGMPGWRFAQRADARYVSVGSPGLRAVANLRRGNGTRRIHVVVTDEGIGTYGSMSTRFAAMRRQGVRSVAAGAKAALVTASARALTTERWPAYRRARGAWQVVPEVAREFTRHTPAGSAGRRTAVVLTQPFVDLGLVSERAYLGYVRGLVDRCVAAGYEPVVRPHPSEDVTRYEGFDLMTGRGTAELDPLVLGAAVVLGGPSTALVNLAAMFDMRVVWVSESSLAYLDTDVSRSQTEIFATFLGEPVRPQDVAARLP